MAKISYTGEETRAPSQRQSIYEALGVDNEGPSPRGSTYHKKLLICPREFAFYTVLKLHPEYPSEALTVGWLIHYCLQRYYEAIYHHQEQMRLANGGERPFDDPTFFWGGHREAMAAAYRVVEELSEVDGYAETVETCQRILDGYFELYHQQDRWVILAVEETIFYRGPFDYSSRLDLIVWDLDKGGMWIVEHKTARILNSDLLDNYQMDLQILGHVWLVEACIDATKYPPFRGVRVNLATKHKTPQFARVDVCPSRDHLAAFENTVGNFHTIRTTMEQLEWPKFLGHCAGYVRGYSKCEYFDLCHGHPAMSVEDWRQQKEPPMGYVHG